MSSPSKPVPATPVRAPRFKSATPGSATSTRAQCSDDPADFALIKIHTAKCSICDKRNASDEMRRCKGCTWQICRPCQVEREQKGRSLAHGNLMSATPTGSVARRRALHPMGLQAEVKDPHAEAALELMKDEEHEEASTKAKAVKIPDTLQEVITPPSSSERQKHERKAKTNKSLAETEVESDDDNEEDDEEEVQVRDHLSPFGGVGSKRRLSFKDAFTTANESCPNKRARMETPERMKAPTSLPAEWDMTPRELENLQTKKYNNLAELRGMRPSQHPTIMKEKHGIDIAPGSTYAGSQTQSIRQHGMPTPYSRPTTILLGALPNSNRRKSGKEVVEEIQAKVRLKLTERYGWPAQTPAFKTSPPTELPTVGELKDGTLRDLVDREMRNLHHNLALDDDQQNELLSTMKGAARRFGNDMVKSMPAAFRAMSKPGLDLALEHLTDAQQGGVMGIIHSEAAKKLMEFEAEMAVLAVDRRDRPADVHASREDFPRSSY